MTLPRTILLLLVPATVLSQVCRPMDAPGPLDTVKLLIVEQHYDEAEEILQRLVAEDRDNIHVLSQRLTTRQTEILEYESYVLDGASFIAFADSVLEVLHRQLPRLHGPDSLDCMFYIASAIGGRGVMQAKVGNWFSAVKSALKSRDLLEKLIEKDTTYFAAFLGIGAFDYYLSQGLKWLPLFNKTKEGIAAIERASHARFPYDIAAKNVLCWIYMERDRYADCDSVCTSVLRQFPDNSVFVKIGTCNALWTQRWEETIRRATLLVSLATSRDPVNWCDLLTGYRSMVDAYLELGDTASALATVQKSQRTPVPPEYLKIPYVKEHLDRIREVQRRHDRR